MTRKKPSRILTCLLITICFGVPVLVPMAAAQQPAMQQPKEKPSATVASRHRFQYAVKFLCTANIPGTSQTSSSVLPGEYVTAVNVHNPNAQTVLLRKKIALTGPSSGEEPGLISKWIEHKLATDQAFGVGCEQITREFGIKPIHGAEGFLVIESTGSLDVTAVYTAGKSGGVESIAVEQIRERIMR